MSDFFSLSFDFISSPNIHLNAIDQSINQKMPGWGIGWYPNDDSAATTIKDSGSDNINLISNTINNWNQFRSTTFLCKVRGASKNYTQQDTQPFSKNYGGREWLFAHNGDLDKNKLGELYKSNTPLLEPVSKTDSELIFCYLLNQIYWNGAKRLADLDWSGYYKWVSEIDPYGPTDLLLTDGQITLAYHGLNSKAELYYKRLVPPHEKVNYYSEAMSFDISDPLDTRKTAVIVTSCNFQEDSFTPMQKGQMLIIRQGEIIWEKSPDNAPVLSNSQVDKNLIQHQAKTPGYNQGFQQSIQQEQAQSIKKVVNVKSITKANDGTDLNFKVYNISHSTVYNYKEKVEKSSHHFRLQPVEDAVQEVLQSTLEISVPNQQVHFEDVFNNKANFVNIDTPYHSLEIKSVTRVRIYAEPPVDFAPLIRRQTIPLVWMPWQRQMMLPFLMPIEIPETQLRELADYAMSFAERNDYNIWATINNINQHIYEDYKYEQGSTSLQTTPFDVFSSRKGVCQDFANLFICLCRLLNIPARYRVGYIFTGADYKNKIQGDASHAWAEVYLPFIGWKGWDPTNGCQVAQEHIRVACGRNYRDAAPTSGTIYKGGGDETMTISVKVEPVLE